MNVPAEVLPGIWQLKLPLIGNSLREVNCYLLRDEDGYALVDCGWDTVDSFEALNHQLELLNVPIDALRTLVVTHIHADHYGMAGRIQQLARSHLVLHRLERAFIDSRFAYPHLLVEEMHHYLYAHGVPDDDARRFAESSLPLMDRVHVAHPDQVVNGGETLRVGGAQYQVVWTPGHTAGHICLFSEERAVLLAGDHILERISPNIGSHVQTFGAPLADYLDSLGVVARLNARLVLPGHGNIFSTLPERAREIQEHHRERLRIMAELVLAEPMTAFQVARRVRWSRRATGWDAMPDFHQRAAVGESVAHLEYLAGRGVIAKDHSRGLVVYGPPLPPAESVDQRFSAHAIAP
jgi:glyoxylase-like metal-dependent hydrolase (beta-lactamase superfamily II)